MLSYYSLPYSYYKHCIWSLIIYEKWLNTFTICINCTTAHSQIAIVSHSYTKQRASSIYLTNTKRPFNFHDLRSSWDYVFRRVAHLQRFWFIHIDDIFSLASNTSRPQFFLRNDTMYKLPSFTRLFTSAMYMDVDLFFNIFNATRSPTNTLELEQS